MLPETSNTREDTFAERSRGLTRPLARRLHWGRSGISRGSSSKIVVLNDRHVAGSVWYCRLRSTHHLSRRWSLGVKCQLAQAVCTTMSVTMVSIFVGGCYGDRWRGHALGLSSSPDLIHCCVPGSQDRERCGSWCYSVTGVVWSSVYRILHLDVALMTVHCLLIVAKPSTPGTCAPGEATVR